MIRELLSDSGEVSSKRVTMLLAAAALAISVVVLSIAAVMGREVAAALGAVAVPLAGLGGYSYVQGSRVQSQI